MLALNGALDNDPLDVSCKIAENDSLHCIPLQIADTNYKMVVWVNLARLPTFEILRDSLKKFAASLSPYRVRLGETCDSLCLTPFSVS